MELENTAADAAAKFLEDVPAIADDLTAEQRRRVRPIRPDPGVRPMPTPDQALAEMREEARRGRRVWLEFMLEQLDHDQRAQPGFPDGRLFSLTLLEIQLLVVPELTSAPGNPPAVGSFAKTIDKIAAIVAALRTLGVTGLAEELDECHYVLALARRRGLLPDPPT
jgi:hypothetical protein